jgi:SAM-dependent methyltransferase
VGGVSALDAYESFAPIYNAFNHRNNYELWLGRVLLPELEKHGLKRNRVLDVACGTGRAFGPLMRRGWQVRGCDLSPSMLEWAQREGDGKVELDRADMRELPVYGEFELVLSLNDSINYLLGDDDLRCALAGMEANLTEGGLVLFDVNARRMYEGDGSWASGSRLVEHDGRRWTWRATGEVEPLVHEVRIEGDGVQTVVNRQRFRSPAEVRDALGAAGLECCAVLGMDEVDGEVVLFDPPDEDRHYKVVYIAAKRDREPVHTALQAGQERR